MITGVQHNRDGRNSYASTETQELRVAHGCDRTKQGPWRWGVVLSQTTEYTVPTVLPDSDGPGSHVLVQQTLPTDTI